MAPRVGSSKPPSRVRGRVRRSDAAYERTRTGTVPVVMLRLSRAVNIPI